MEKRKIFFTILILLLAAGCGGGSGESGGGVSSIVGSSSGSDGNPGGNSLSQGTISLVWNPSSSPNVGGYKVYYGTASKNYGTPIDVGNVTAYTLKGLIIGRTYFVAVTAYDTSREESGFSNEVNGPAK